MQLAEARHILMIKHGAFGDLIFADGVMRAIRAHVPQAHITLLTAPLYARLWAQAPYIDATLADPRAQFWQLRQHWALAQKLRQAPIDFVIDLQNSTRSSAYYKFFGDIPISGTRKGASLRHFYERHPDVAISDVLAGQVAALGVPFPNGASPDLRWIGQDSAQFLPKTDQPHILLVPGASARNRDKRWPHFPALATELARNGYSCVIAPGPDEMHMVHEMPCPALLDNGRPLSFSQLAGLAPHLAHVIGNDTGPCHLMAACGVPATILLGPRGEPGRIRVAADTRFMQVPNLADLSLEEVMQTVGQIVPKGQ